MAMPLTRPAPSGLCRERGAFAFLPRPSTYMALVLSAVFLLPTGCATKAAARPEAPMTQEEAAAEISTKGWNLSPESEEFYYRLLLAEATKSRNLPVVREALRGLLNLSPTLDAFQESAAILLSFEEYDAAHTATAEGLRRFPGDAMLIQLQAEILRISGNAAEGVRILEAYLQGNPKDYGVTEELIRSYILMGNTKKADQLLRSIPVAERSQNAVIFEAYIVESQGNPTKAKAILKAALKKNPSFGLALAELARINEKMNLPQEALAAYRELLELTSIESTSPEHFQIRLQILRIQLIEGQIQEALATVNDGPKSASFLLEAANRFSRAGQFAEAEKLLRESEQYGVPPEETALNLSALRLLSTKDPRAAIVPLESIATKHPLYPEAMLRKVQLLAEAGDDAAAAEAATAARKNAPESKLLWGVEAHSLSRLGKHAEAAEIVEKALNKFPGDEQLLFTLASIQDAGGDKKAALSTMERLIQQYPSNAQALNYVGYTLAEENRDLERALSLINSALEQTPKASHIVDSLAWVQYRLGLYAEAWKSIQRCIELGGNESVIWEHYADIALALGKKAEARKGLQTAIDMKPDNVEEIRAKLEKIK